MKKNTNAKSDSKLATLKEFIISTFADEKEKNKTTSDPEKNAIIRWEFSKKKINKNIDKN